MRSRPRLPLVAALTLLALAGCTSLLGDFSQGSGSDAGADATSEAAPGTDAPSGGDGTTSAEAGSPEASPVDGGPGDTGSPIDTGADTAPSIPDSGTDAPSDGAPACTMTVCGTTCTNTMTDPHHCGSCATDCATLPHVTGTTGLTCSAGQCVVPPSDCEPGYAHCSTKPLDGCEASLGQSSSCGSCTTTCSGATSLCQLNAGTGTYGCVSSCSGNTPTLCGNSCTDTNTDPNNCKTCNTVCPAVTGGGVPTCAGGVCGVTCNSGEHQCGTTTMCALDTDPNNCGPSCTKCAPPGGGTVSCTNNACVPACPSTQTVIGGTCTCPSNTPTFCGSGSSGTCVDTTSDANNCGSCGRSCLGGSCLSGVCQPWTVGGTSNPSSVATDGTNIYWTEATLQTLLEVPAAGGNPITLATGAVTGAAYGGGHVSYLGNGSGFGFAVAGQASSGTSLSTTYPCTSALVSPSGSQFFCYGGNKTAGYALVGCGLTPASCTKVAAPIASSYEDIAVDGSAFWYLGFSNAVNVNRWPLSSPGFPTTGTSTYAAASVLALVSDGTYVDYLWSVTNSYVQALYRTPAAAPVFDGSQTALVNGGLGTFNFAATATAVYSFVNGNSIIATPTSGGAPVYLYSGSAYHSIDHASAQAYFNYYPNYQSAAGHLLVFLNFATSPLTIGAIVVP